MPKALPCHENDVAIFAGMKRTQIQLPDRLFERLKARVKDEESTLTEVMRKAGEY